MIRSLLIKDDINLLGDKVICKEDSKTGFILSSAMDGSLIIKPYSKPKDPFAGSILYANNGCLYSSDEDSDGECSII